MSSSKKIILRVDKRNPKSGYLKLQTIINRKSKEKSLKIKVQVKNWNSDKQFLYSTEPDADRINQIIQQVLREEKGVEIKKVDKNSFIDFAENTILPSIFLKSTRDIKKFSLNKLKEFLESEGKNDLLFTEVDLFFIKKYYNYLLGKCKISTANAYMTYFKYFINQADNHDHYIYKKDPFKNLKKNSKNSKHEVMTSLEVDAFFQYEPEDESFLHVKNGFGFMMYSAGMRVSDLLNLKWGNFKKSGASYFLEYPMQKTKQIMTPKLTLEALQFLIPFIEEYDKKATKGYRFLKKKNEELGKSLEKFIEEEGEIKLVQFSDFKWSFMDGSQWEKIPQMIEDATKKEERKIVLQQNIPALREAIEFNKNQMLEILGEEVLRLKESHATENVLPHLRNVSEKDIEKVRHRATTSFNYRLKVIGKKTGIKTKMSNHQARHVFAQILFENGANFHHISLALGHRNLETTENYRSKLITDKAKDVVKEFSKIRPITNQF